MVASLGRTVLVAVGLVMARTVAAQPAEPAPLRLVVTEGASRLDAHRIRAKLETEVGRPVRLADGAGSAPPLAIVTMGFRAAENELTVGYLPLAGERVARTVAPAAGDDAVEIAVLLAGNLVRDQASELLAPPDISPSPPAHESARGVVAAAPAAPPESPTPQALTMSWLPPLLGAGRVEAAAWTGNLGLLNAGLRLSMPLPAKSSVPSGGSLPAASPEAYAILSASGHREEGRRMVGPGLALGIAVPWKQLAIEVDLDATFLYGLEPGTNGYTNTRLVTRLRTALAYRSSAAVTLFVGVAPALLTRFYGSGPDNETGAELFGGARL